MKKIILLAALLSLYFAGYSQTVKRTKDGNFIQVTDTAARTQATATGKTYTDKDGNKFPVMISKNGKLFVIRTSKKTGKQYSQYLKIN